MTTKERTTVQGFINKITELDNIIDETLQTLQDMNIEHGDGHRWCSWDGCLDGIAKYNTRESIEYRRAANVYRKFVEASAKRDLITSFGGELAELGFWKNQDKRG